MSINDTLSRERLAGYDPALLQNAKIAIVGAGALGNNAVQTLTLSGCGELRVVDFDVIEPSNATRSPCLPKAAALGNKRRSKAKVLAEWILANSYATAPVVRYAPKRLEALGMGAFKGCNVIVSAVDSFRARARLADVARLLRIPLVEGGFNGSRGQVSVYTNDSPNAPCYRCLNPHSDDGVSCSLYARSVLTEGQTPATQSIAALTAAYVAEATIRLIHPTGSPLANRMLSFDVGSGRGALMSLTRDPECLGVHRIVASVHSTRISPRDPACRLFDAAGDIGDVEIALPFEYLVAAPCTKCGARVHVGKPEWEVTEAPHCTTCAPDEEHPVGSVITASRVRAADDLARRPLKKLGFAPVDLVEFVDRSTGESHWLELDGSIDDLFVAKCGIAQSALISSDDFIPATASSEEPRQ